MQRKKNCAIISIISFCQYSSWVWMIKCNKIDCVCWHLLVNYLCKKKSCWTHLKEIIITVEWELRQRKGKKLRKKRIQKRRKNKEREEPKKKNKEQKMVEMKRREKSEITIQNSYEEKRSKQNGNFLFATRSLRTDQWMWKECGIYCVFPS